MRKWGQAALRGTARRRRLSVPGVARPGDAIVTPVQRGSIAFGHAATAHRFPRGTAIAVAPQPQPATPEPPEPERRELVPAAGDWRARATRQRHRWHEPPVERATHRWTLAAVLLLHALFALVAWYGTRPPVPHEEAPPEQFLQIRLIEDTPASHAPPPLALPPAPPAAPPPTRARPEPPAKGAMVVQAPPLRLYDEHGQPLLPPAPVSSAPVPGYVQRMPQGDTQVMRHDSPVKYKPTRFADDWDKGGSSVDSALQKLVDKTTKKTTIHLPGGIRIHCAVSLAMLAGGCGGDSPPPPSAKSGDMRLNMAPASTPDGRTHGFTPPGVEACIAMYRAGKPLAQGCPVDTPDRAVDEELRERKAARGAGR
jgi:hypothetical protein